MRKYVRRIRIHRAIIEPIRKAALYGALHVMRAADIELWITPRARPKGWHACLKNAKGSFQLAADVKILPGRDDPWQDGRKQMLIQVEKIRFYPFRQKGKLFPLSDDQEK